MNRKKIVLTGATSFIGVHVVKEFINKDADIFAVVRPKSPNLSRLSKWDSIHIIELEMREYDRLVDYIDEADVFIHLSWEGTRATHRDDVYMQQKNYECAVQTMEVARKLGCRIYLGAGSQAEYGIMDGCVSETAPCNPITEYGKNKLLACERLMRIANDNAIRFIWTRIFSIYGKYDYPGTLIMSALGKMIKNVPIEMTACTQLWDYLYVEDVARAMYMLIENEEASGIYNVASGDNKPLMEYIGEMKKVLKSKSELRFGAVPYGEVGPVDLRPDVSKLYSIGWKPIIKFNDGIKMLI